MVRRGRSRPEARKARRPEVAGRPFESGRTAAAAQGTIRWAEAARPRAPAAVEEAGLACCAGGGRSARAVGRRASVEPKAPASGPSSGAASGWTSRRDSRSLRACSWDGPCLRRWVRRLRSPRARQCPVTRSAEPTCRDRGRSPCRPTLGSATWCRRGDRGRSDEQWGSASTPREASGPGCLELAQRGDGTVERRGLGSV